MEGRKNNNRDYSSGSNSSGNSRDYNRDNRNNNNNRKFGGGGGGNKRNYNNNRNHGGYRNNYNNSNNSYSHNNNFNNNNENNFENRNEANIHQTEQPEVSSNNNEVTTPVITTEENQENIEISPEQLEELSRVHHLQNEWSFWYDLPVKKNVKNWENNIRRIAECATVEDFWRIFNNIRPASDINTGCNYYLFKSGIEPKWEDPNNINGGKWYIVYNDKLSDIDDKWLNALLSCIGEMFTDTDEVCGVVFSNRAREDRISFWTKDTHEDITMEIGLKIKEVLNISGNTKMQYISHQAAMKTPPKKKVPFKYALPLSK